MLRTSSQCVQWTFAITAGSIRSVPAPAVPNSGFIASGVSPRHPTMHSLLPGRPVNGFGNVALVFRPSSHSRFSQFAHFGLAASVTSM
jgi:hypothetical protein